MKLRSEVGGGVMATPFPDGELDGAAEVGAVDSQGLRLWVRQAGAAEVSATLEVAGQPPVTASTPLSPDTDWTGVVVLTLPAPAPGCAFTCQVGERRLTGRLAPAAGTRAELTFAFGSCHHPFVVKRRTRVLLSRAVGLYPAMIEEVGRAEAAFLLLVGDQIYSDALKPISVREDLPKDKDVPPPLEEVLAAYRRIYRGYFGQAGFRRLRERLPTLCMWDDHDIFNNWGSRRRETALDRRLFAAASRAYCEYQHWRNPGGGLGHPPYHYTFAYGDIGFLVLDARGVRDHQSRHLLGAAQWEAVRAFLAGAAAREFQTLFVVSSVPVAHTARWFAQLSAWLPMGTANSVRARWTAPAVVRARDAFYDVLFAWQAAAPGRQVILLSGDIHMASAWTIAQRAGPGVIQQFTSSALTTPLGRMGGLLNWVAGLSPNLLEPRFRFQRHFLDGKNNFGLVRLTPLPAGGHRVVFTVRGWQPRSRTLTTVAEQVCLPGGHAATSAQR